MRNVAMTCLGQLLKSNAVQRFVLVCTAAAIIVPLPGCYGSPPQAACLRGTFTLNKDNAVHLALSHGRFQFKAHGEKMTGRYEYMRQTRAGDMPGSGNIAFYRKAGTLSENNRLAIYRETGENEDVLPFLDSLKANTGQFRPVYEGADHTLNIVLDSDLDTLALEFSKTGCT